MSSGESMIIGRPAFELYPGGVSVSFFQYLQPSALCGGQISSLHWHLRIELLSLSGGLLCLENIDLYHLLIHIYHGEIVGIVFLYPLFDAF